MKLKGRLKEDLCYAGEEVTSHIRKSMTLRERLSKVVFKCISKGTKGVYNTEEEVFITEDGNTLYISLEHIDTRG